MRVFITGTIFVIGYVLQTTVIQYIQIGDIKPNLVVMLILCFALLGSGLQGAFAGLFGGMLLDIPTSKTFGLNMLAGLYIGVLTGYYNKRFFKENYIVVLLFVFVLTICYELIFFFLNYFIWGETKIIKALLDVILPEALYNSALAVPVYIFVLKINNWLENKENSRW